MQSQYVRMHKPFQVQFSPITPGYSLFELLPCNSCTVFIIDAELGIVAEPLLYGENVSKPVLDSPGKMAGSCCADHDGRTCLVISSNFARVNVASKCNGPAGPAEIMVS